MMTLIQKEITTVTYSGVQDPGSGNELLENEYKSHAETLIY